MKNKIKWLKDNGWNDELIIQQLCIDYNVNNLKDIINDIRIKIDSNYNSRKLLIRGLMVGMGSVILKVLGSVILKVLGGLKNEKGKNKEFITAVVNMILQKNYNIFIRDNQEIDCKLSIGENINILLDKYQMRNINDFLE